MRSIFVQMYHSFSIQLHYPHVLWSSHWTHFFDTVRSRPQNKSYVNSYVISQISSELWQNYMEPSFHRLTQIYFTQFWNVIHLQKARMHTVRYTDHLCIGLQPASRCTLARSCERETLPSESWIMWVLALPPPHQPSHTRRATTIIFGEFNWESGRKLGREVLLLSIYHKEIKNGAEKSTANLWSCSASPG